MGTGSDASYSAMEVIPGPYIHQIIINNQQRENPDLGKQVIPHEGLQVALGDDGKQHVVDDDDGIQPVAKGDDYAHDDCGDHHVRSHRPSRKKQILVGGAVGLMVIIAVVLGSVFGVRYQRSGIDYEGCELGGQHDVNHQGNWHN